MAGMSTEGWLPALGMEEGSVGSGMEEEGLRRRLESVREEAGVLREEEADASGRRRPAPRAGGSGDDGRGTGTTTETTAATQGRRRRRRPRHRDDGGDDGRDTGTMAGCTETAETAPTTSFALLQI